MRDLGPTALVESTTAQDRASRTRDAEPGAEQDSGHKDEGGGEVADTEGDAESVIGGLAKRHRKNLEDSFKDSAQRGGHVQHRGSGHRPDHHPSPTEGATPLSPVEQTRRDRHERLLRRADERLLVELWRFFDVVDLETEPHPNDPVEVLALGNLENVIDELRNRTRDGLEADGDAATTHDPAAGRVGTEQFAWQLRWQLFDLGVRPNPLPGNYLDAVNVDELIDLAGGRDAWEQTRACDRPVLILRRVVRPAVDPGASSALPDPRDWWEEPR